MNIPKKVLFATFSLRLKNERTAINGMIEPMLSYFLPKAEVIDIIDGLHPGSDSVFSLFENYINNKLVKKHLSWISLLLYPVLKIPNDGSTQIFYKIRDFLSVFEIILKQRKKYDLFVGMESIYTLAGIILKRLGLVKTVVYYVSDYCVNRYPNKLLNKIYLALDRACCYHADYIWDVSPAMLPARIKAGLDKKRCKPVILVPNALFEKQISYLPPDRLQPFSLVYAGTLGEENGPDLAIEAMAEIIKKIPQVKLNILGGDKFNLERLKLLAEKYNVEKNIVFHGFISDAVKVSELTRQFMLGLAPYRAFPDSARWYADATKIRLYFGAGLPVITTHVPPLGKEVEEKNAGIIIKDNADELTEAVIKVLSNEKLYKKMRENAIAFAKHNTWENSYKEALLKMN